MKNLSRIIIPTELQAEAMPPPSPHFDDEATLLTARAVVPIDVAAASGNIRNYLVKAAIVLAAALLGAAAAVSVDFFQNPRPAAATAVVEPSAPATPGAVSETLETSQPSLQQSHDSTVSASKTSPAATADQSDLSETKPIKTREMTTAKDSDQAKEKPAVYEAATNRRNVRVTRSERQAQRRQAARVQRAVAADQIIERPRDAGRIREIFEGPSPF